MSTIRVDIVSAESEIFSGQASMVFAPAIEGEVGIAPRHAPLITRLKPGEVRVQTPDGEEQQYYISGGLLEVQPRRVTVLADTAVRAADLDEAAALQAVEKAEEAIANRTGSMEIATARGQLAEAAAQLQAIQRLRKRAKR
jgi:F-type H+-transporting ATPase subunit epsilon